MKEEFGKSRTISLQDDSIKISQKDLGDDDCEIETSKVIHEH